MRDWRRTLYFVLAWVCVGLGVIGLVLPIVPTTPFLLVASSLFLRSSPRFRDWLLRNRWFGPMLREWDEHKAVRLSVKVLAVTVVAVAIGLVMLRPVHWGVRTAVVVLGLIGIGVIWKLPVIGRMNDRPANDPTAPPPSGERGRRDLSSEKPESTEP
jgi:hypothetical protein